MRQLGCVDLEIKLQKQKKGPWSLGERKQMYCLEGKTGVGRKGAGIQVREREREHLVHTGSFVLRGFIWFLKVGVLGEVSIKNLNRIFISFSGVSFLGRGLY